MNALEETTLHCAGCKQRKSKGEFTASQQAHPTNARCKQCVKAYNVKWRAENPDRIRELHAEWWASHKEEASLKFKQRWATRRKAYEPARQKWAQENREKNLAYYRQRRVDFVAFTNSLKEGKPCADCGEVYPPYVMDFDHVRGKKRFTIGRMTNHRHERVLEEIEKCDVVCCICHRLRTHLRRRQTRAPSRRAFREWIQSLKTDPCKDCGQAYPPVAMDFDHVLGSKVEGISNMAHWTREAVFAEMAKCDLVCANCHRERTYGNSTFPAPEAVSETVV